jgi:ribosomal protein L25 (general stress protein Ctc)
VVYGAKKDSIAVTVSPKQITKILHSATGHNTIFDLQINGGKEKVMIVDWQYEPIKGALLHIDMKRIDMAATIRVSVPLNLVGESAGVKQQGGIMDQVLREVELECLGIRRSHSCEGPRSWRQVQVHYAGRPGGGAHHHSEGRSCGHSGCDCGGCCGWSG